MRYEDPRRKSCVHQTYRARHLGVKYDIKWLKLTGGEPQRLPANRDIQSTSRPEQWLDRLAFPSVSSSLWTSFTFRKLTIKLAIP